MQWSRTLDKSPSNAMYGGPWQNGDGSYQQGLAIVTQPATITLQTSNDGKTVASSVTATGTGALQTAAVAPAPYFRLLYQNSGTADPGPIILSIGPAAAPAPSSGSVHRAQTTMSGNWNIPAQSTWEIVTGWTGTVMDTDGYWSNTHPERLTVPAGLGGLYLCGFTISAGAGNTSLGRWLAGLQKNGAAAGTLIPGTGAETDPGSNGAQMGGVNSCPIALADGDYITAGVYSSMNGAQSVDHNNAALWVVRLGAS